MSFKIAETTVSAAVASAGTITFSYPDGTDSGTFKNAKGHKLWVAGHQTLYAYITDFTISFGTADITVTYNGSTSIPAASDVSLQLDTIGPDSGDIETRLATAKRVSVMTPVRINLGAPDVADADGVCASQSGTAATAMTIAGALASGGVATFDVPRNVVAAWTGTAILTVVGTDDYGNAMSEASASGTSMAGKKAFKTVTSVTPSANTTGHTVGTGDVLGLPVFLPEKGLVVAENEDGAAATAGTIVAGVTTAATTTTGDVRGTYDANSAADGAKNFSLLAYVEDPSDLGGAQA